MIKSMHHIAVVTPEVRDFNRFETDNICIGTIYHHVTKLDDLRGKVFNSRILLYGWNRIKNVEELIAVLSTRIKMI